METNTRKGGRPRLADSQKKNFIVKISLDKGQYNLVEYKAKKAGISVSEYCREASLDNKISPVLTPDQLDALRKSDIYSQATNALSEILSLLHHLKK